MSSAAPAPAITVRLAQARDRTAVRSLLQEAFAGPTEADLVERLHREDDLIAAWVGEHATGGVCGYVAFPRLCVQTPAGPVSAAGLAPLAVLPKWQRRGVGSHLVRAGLADLLDRGERLVFVVGDPGYYRRFGFDLTAASSFASPYAGPHFMVRRLAIDAPVCGAVHYPAAFAELG